MAESKEAIDSYLATLDATRRGALSDLRQQIHELVPEVEECISYGLPGFRLQSKMIAGFGAFKDHLSYFPHSGSVLEILKDDLVGYSRTKSALHFSTPLPKTLVEKLVTTRIQQALNDSRS